MSIRLLHTSDWHLGRLLYGRRRTEDFEQLVAWMAQTIRDEAVNLLLVAGDVFDTSTPGSGMQELYYGFLHQVAAAGCRHVVIVGGNHDSPSLLDAPARLLRTLRIHVVGSAAEDPADEIVVLRDEMAQAQAIVCAVPFLRDRDVRSSDAGETAGDKERRLLQGIRSHYERVVSQACAMRDAIGKKETAGGAEALPLIVTGHLFTDGGQLAEQDGERDLYVGTLAAVPASTFAPEIDYLALGHLHVPQLVGGSPQRRYSGAPLALGFGEADSRKSVCLVTFEGRQADVRTIAVPSFRDLRRVRGDWPAVEAQLAELKAAGSQAWLEVVLQGSVLQTDLRERIDAATAGSALEVLRITSPRLLEGALTTEQSGESLADLSETDVFERRLEQQNLAEHERVPLRAEFAEVLAGLADADLAAEGADV